MCRWPLRAPTTLQSILWPIIDPSQSLLCISNFCDPNLVTFYFYELTHFSFRLNEQHFTVSSAVTNILVLLLTVNRKNCLTPKNPKMCDPILVTRPHPAAHPHYPLLGKYPPGLEFSRRAWTNCSKYFQVNPVMI